MIVLLANPRRIASKSERLRLRWQRLNEALPFSGLDLVRLRCRCCSTEHTIALPRYAVLRELLAEMSCPTCCERGTLGIPKKNAAEVG